MNEIRVHRGRVPVSCLKTFGALIALALSAVARAAWGGPATMVPGELRLPAEILYEKTVGPDSAVAFRHDTHVALAGQKCTGCHPQLFRMLKPVRRASHRVMRRGGSCGACHDGRRAFGISDPGSCASCHAGKQEHRSAATGPVAGRSTGRAMPRPISYARGESSPGQVTFRHERHTKTACVGCHGKLFAMKSAGTRTGGAMHEPSACGACHDGDRAFGVEEAGACARCHVAATETP
jgi:c(7)-type cytochrome triheme protein